MHDPLINWRLLNTTDAADTTAIDAQLNSMQVLRSNLLLLGFQAFRNWFSNSRLLCIA